MNNSILKKEDYEEPCCPLSKPGAKSTIPVGRVMEKLDSYLEANDYAGAERHLNYWLESAEQYFDRRGALSVLNEQIGLYRKLDRKEECLQAIEKALPLCPELGMENSVSYGTTLINAATGYKAFGMAKTALPLYRDARALYERWLKPGDARLGGLYNNMALTLSELGEYREAEDLFHRALDVMAQQEHGEPEMAITWLNLADLTVAEQGMEAGEETIAGYLEKAEALLNTPDLPRNGYYAFVCEKCAPVFGEYGWFMTARTLSERARSIYDRT